jgi:hypothetical protein
MGTSPRTGNSIAIDWDVSLPNGLHGDECGRGQRSVERIVIPERTASAAGALAGSKSLEPIPVQERAHEDDGA